MPVISLETKIKAPIEVCFDLCCSIDLHKISTDHTKEEAIAGVVSGLKGPGETVTWRAKHFGIWQQLTSRITEFERPHLFVDVLEKGAFKDFNHRHDLKQVGDYTLMNDTFDYTSPLGLLGRAFDVLVLEKHMADLLEKRNSTIKEFAENGKWKELITIPKKTI